MPAAVQPACILYMNELSLRETLSNTEKNSDSTNQLYIELCFPVHRYVREKNVFYYDLIIEIKYKYVVTVVKLLFYDFRTIKK